MTLCAWQQKKHSGGGGGGWAGIGVRGGGQALGWGGEQLNEQLRAQETDKTEQGQGSKGEDGEIW